VAGIRTVPNRGEIWLIQFPTDPPEKAFRPVVIVSLNARNHSERANTVLAIPLSTSVHKMDHPSHMHLQVGETGLSADSIARAEDISVVKKESLLEPRSRLGALSHSRICQLAAMVKLAMGCV
jgi:mRNA-degrading endonuclease toxin of MazEF toxin-antitoxin module